MPILVLLASRSSPADGKVVAPSLSVSDAAVTEDGSAVGAVFSVRLSPASGKTVRVQFATADGSAKAGSDYVARRGPLTFKPRQRLKRVVVSVLGDATPEAEETFFVTLSRPRNARIAKRRGKGVIRANDLPAAFTLKAAMDGDQVVGPSAPGTRGARGTFVATFDPANAQFSFTLTIEGMDEPVFAIHIHKAPRGQSGEASVQNVDPFPAQNGTTSGVKRLSLASILEIFSNPSDFNVEVHTVDLTGGIRGQLSPP